MVTPTPPPPPLPPHLTHILYADFLASVESLVACEGVQVPQHTVPGGDSQCHMAGAVQGERADRSHMAVQSGHHLTRLCSSSTDPITLCH